jgi:hypothetical protein
MSSNIRLDFHVKGPKPAVVSQGIKKPGREAHHSPLSSNKKKVMVFL